MPPQHGDRPKATVSDIVDAVVLYDHPLLDHRFSELATRHPDPDTRRELLALPAVVTRGARITRAAAFEWERVADAFLVHDTVLNSERVLLQACLDSAEAQIRLKAFIARQAPTREVRDTIETAIGLHRDVTQKLRHALATLGTRSPHDPKTSRARGVPRYAQAEEESTDLRGQVERAIRSMRESGKEPRAVTVSHVALRHLRDQDAFRDDDTRILGVPVNVDLSWEASEFALHSHDTVPLEEIVRAAQEREGTAAQKA